MQYPLRKKAFKLLTTKNTEIVIVSFQLLFNFISQAELTINLSNQGKPNQEGSVAHSEQLQQHENNFPLIWCWHFLIQDFLGGLFY